MPENRTISGVLVDFSYGFLSGSKKDEAMRLMIGNTCTSVVGALGSFGELGKRKFA